MPLPFKILVTAGSTNIPIDRVRTISNIFKGRTGNTIAEFLADRGYEVTLITSSPNQITPRAGLTVVNFNTYNELEAALEEQFAGHTFDAVVHSAAVSDYYVSEVCVQEENGALVPVDRSAKISSKHEKMYLELRSTRKLIDLMRTIWNFHGFLVKFKLQVAMTDEELVAIARESRVASNADICVANCLEWAKEYAYIVGANDLEKVGRNEISAAIERRFHAHLAGSDR